MCNAAGTSTVQGSMGLAHADRHPESCAVPELVEAVLLQQLSVFCRDV